MAEPTAAPGRALSNQAVLIVHSDDRLDIVAAVSTALSRLGANIVTLDQQTDDPAGGRFCQRTVFDLPDLVIATPVLRKELEEVVGTGWA